MQFPMNTRVSEEVSGWQKGLNKVVGIRPEADVDVAGMSGRVGGQMIDIPLGKAAGATKRLKQGR